MLLDLTSRPVKVHPEECQRSIIVRTLSGKDADGLLRRTEDRRGRTVHHNIKPIASLKKDDVTYMEARLPLDHVQRAKPKGTPVWKKEEEIILPSPFEVVSYYVDSVTKQRGTWRANVIVELNINGRLWYVSVQDETRSIPLLTIVVKDLDTSAIQLEHEAVPLQRYMHKEGRPVTAWDRIREAGELDDT